MLPGKKSYHREPCASQKSYSDCLSEPLEDWKDLAEDAINTVAQALSKNYLTPSGSFYYGKTMEAVNTKYASDSGWHEKVYSYMEYLYDKLE